MTQTNIVLATEYCGRKQLHHVLFTELLEWEIRKFK